MHINPLAKNQNIIKIFIEKIGQPMECVIYESLEHSWGIGVSKWYHLEFIEPTFACKGSPVLMLWCI